MNVLTHLSIRIAWVFVILGDSYDHMNHTWNPDGRLIVHQQDFWFALGMTVLYAESICLRKALILNHHSVIMPWLTVRKVPVVIEVV